MKKIVICGSMKFSKEMVDAVQKLKTMGIEAVIPSTALKNAQTDCIPERGENLQRKINCNGIYMHYKAIEESDAVLILNYDKNNIENYIGANTFLEMGFAHVLNKQIYVLNRLPEIDYIIDELHVFNPVILDGCLEGIIFNL